MLGYEVFCQQLSGKTSKTCILTDVHKLQAEGNLFNECGRAPEPGTVEDYS